MIFRIVNFIKQWIKKDFEELYSSNTLELLLNFVNGSMKKIMPKSANEIKLLIEDYSKKNNEEPFFQISNMKPPNPFLPNNLKQELTFQDLHPEEIARQLTLIEHEMFRSIKFKEFLKQKWCKTSSKEQAPNILRMINRFNQVIFT